MEKQVRVTTTTYKLNKLVGMGEAANARHLSYIGVCSACGAPVSSYLSTSAFHTLRPEARSCVDWVACDNADCVHAYGSAHPADWVLIP
jgi:hypothetical protein